MNIYEEIEKGAIIENIVTGNQYEVVSNENEIVTIKRGSEFFEYSEKEIYQNFQYYFPYDNY